MKKAIVLGCFLMGAVGATSPQMVSLPELSDRVMQDFSAGNIGDLIVECPEGTLLPFKLALKGCFLTLEPDSPQSLYLKVLKTCYVRCVGKENYLFSTDLHTWKGFFEFFTGEVKVSVETEEGGPVALLEVELNHRMP